MVITIDPTVNASLEQVWNAWVTPDHIQKWNFATKGWSCPSAQIDVRIGGDFCYRMEARDGSMGFDFEGRFTSIDAKKHIKYTLADNRKVEIQFSPAEQGIKVAEHFEAEDDNSAEYQRQGWQSILDNFKQYVESIAID